MSFLKSAPCATGRLILASILLLLLMLNTAAVAQQVTAPKRSVKTAKKVVPVVPDPPPAPPPPPPTPEQMPAVAPQVRYSHGQLTIVAENSTLADILRAVRAQTGAVVEIPPNANERVVAHLGPGLTRDVLTALLNGSHFNYVMVGSPAHPDSVERLILTSKSGGISESAPEVAGTRSNNPVEMDDQGTQGVDIAEQPVDDPAENPAAAENPPPQPNAQQVKTPEQLLRELQQQQQQLQQQQAPAHAHRRRTQLDWGVGPQPSGLAPQTLTTIGFLGFSVRSFWCGHETGGTPVLHQDWGLAVRSLASVAAGLAFAGYEDRSSGDSGALAGAVGESIQNRGNGRVGR